jgi:hypothetical protein
MDAILLSAATWKRIEKMLSAYEHGRFITKVGVGLKIEDVVPMDGSKISVDLDALMKALKAGGKTIDLAVCIDGSPVTKTFVVL